MPVAQVIFIVIIGYVAVGVVFALAFVTIGVGRTDPIARASGISFRILIIPGVAALWPVLALKWVRARPGTAAGEPGAGT